MEVRESNRERGRENGSFSVAENSELANVRNRGASKTGMSAANEGCEIARRLLHIKSVERGIYLSEIPLLCPAIPIPSVDDLRIKIKNPWFTQGLMKRFLKLERCYYFCFNFST
ncbi:MAG: hypothetical protein JWN37_225 [Candidatus Nomurabacteria bacterium]|nr:hypothetical protein [Candidatus Nomurabacteria bacterium]